MASDTPPQSELHSMRVDYGKTELRESDVAPDPIAQFARWFDDACRAELPEPNAMTLATADASGQPSARIVLMKDVDERGFTFFTNYASRKGDDLAANPRAALLFFWHSLERQVRIEGRVERVTREESADYFAKRPRAAQLGAWASKQSEVLASRAELERRNVEISARYESREVPLPESWGGYRVLPDAMEFWQGRASRLHDRIRYQRQDGGWTIDRLSP